MFTTIGVGICFSIAARTLSAMIFGALWGFVVFAIPSFITDILLYSTILKNDPLFYLRRCLAFSLFSIASLVAVFFVASILTLVIPQFIFPDFAIIMGLFAVIPLRALTAFSMSRTTFFRRTLFTLLEPALMVLAAVLVFGLPLSRAAVGLMIASLVGLAFAFALIIIVEGHGREVIGFSPIRMFRAFLTDWLEGQNEELESYLDELGAETEVDAAAFAFRSQKSGDLKGIMFVSNFHPGPFLNIGSSVLPFLFQRVISRRYGAVTIVPHGVSGHELNLVSQDQNEALIRWVLTSLPNARFRSEATPVVRVNNEIATATSQVFDGCALVTMTTAPDDMEDVPSEVANRLTGLTHGHFNHVALVDAHNSLNGPTVMSSHQIGALEEVALSSLQISAEQKPSKVRVGVAQKQALPFKLRDGFGPAGITAIGVQVNGSKFAYVNIDGNNMVTGLRQRILERIKLAGFDDGEVMTSDTHMVNGLVSARLGYYRIGEVVPHGPLLDEISSVCSRAASNLEFCDVAALSARLPVTTLGPKSLKGLMSVVHRVSKLTAVTLFPLAVLVAALALVFLV